MAAGVCCGRMLLCSRMLRRLCLGSGSGFRRSALLRLLTCGRFCRGSLLPTSGFGCGPLLRLLTSRGLGRSTLLCLLIENFLLLCPLLHWFRLCGRQARGMRGRRSRVRRWRRFAGRPRCGRTICRLSPCGPGHLPGRCRLMRGSLRCGGVYRTRSCGFRFRLSDGPKPRTRLRTGCCGSRRVLGPAGGNASGERRVREIGRARRPSRSRCRNGRLTRLLCGGTRSR